MRKSNRKRVGGNSGPQSTQHTRQSYSVSVALDKRQQGSTHLPLLGFTIGGGEDARSRECNKKAAVAIARHKKSWWNSGPGMLNLQPYMPVSGHPRVLVAHRSAKAQAAKAEY